MSEPRKPVPVTFEWTWSLPLQQQSVLLLACRGPDGLSKYHGTKDVLRHYRACVLKAAYYGRSLALGERADTFMGLDYIADDAAWQSCINRFFLDIDALPHHYLLHLIHGAEILGYKHPDQRIRRPWAYFYLCACNDMHLAHESEAAMDQRLSDWGRANWDTSV